MQKLQLYIGSDRIDLFKDEQVSISQSIQDIKDPAKIFTEFTKAFTLPANSTNNKIFKHYYNFNITDGFDARFKTAANIELNNIAYKKGYVVLNSVELKNNKPYAYKIVFYGETVSLKNLLQDFLIGSLPQLSDYDLTYNAATIEDRLQTNSDSGSGPIICPLITSGASNEESELHPPPSRLYYNSNSYSVADGNVYWHSSAGVNGVLYSDLKYAIRVYEIIKAIESQYTIAKGYATDIVFSTDFFSTTNPEFYNLYLWLHRKKGSVQEDTQVLSNPSPVVGFGASLTYTGMLSTSTLVINALYLPSTQQNLIMTTASSEVYTVLIIRNGVGWATMSEQQGSKTFNAGDMGIMDAGEYSITIFSAGAFTFTSIVWELAGNPPFSAETYTTAFAVTATFTFEITQQVPNIKIIDFLKSLFKMFNLTAYYDDRPLLANGSTNTNFGKIRVQKLEEFYTTNVATYDISKYVDVSTGQVNVALPYREIDFGYTGVGTMLAKQYEQIYGKPWKAMWYKGDDNPDGSNTKYEINVDSEAVMYERLVNVDPTESPLNPPTSIQYGYYVDDNQDAYIGKPLFFYAIHQAAGVTTDSISLLDGTDSQEIDNYFIPSNSLGLDVSVANDQKNINFYPETNEYTTSSGFVKTLFEENYQTYIQDIFNGKRRITRIKAWLPLKIIYNLNMNDTLTINNQNYKINTIKTNLITGESSIELLNEL